MFPLSRTTGINSVFIYKKIIVGQLYHIPILIKMLMIIIESLGKQKLTESQIYGHESCDILGVQQREKLAVFDMRRQPK